MISQGFAPNAPYSRRPPSPPLIPVPVFMQPNTDRGGTNGIIMSPSYDNLDSSQITAEEMRIITEEKKYVATGSADGWRYEQRREAQRILDFLYLGPLNIIRDHDFLQREGITMVMVARDSRISSRNLQSLDKAVHELGIVDQYVALDSAQHLIHKLTETIRIINDHILAVHHSQSRQMPAVDTSARRGKVLIACETGNERSAIIVAAYIMAMYGNGLTRTLQFINLQRFCCIFDEDAKRLLQSWEDILKARTAVSRAQSSITPTGNSKRRIEDTVDATSISTLGDRLSELDMERFEGRRVFEPFVDVQRAH